MAFNDISLQLVSRNKEKLIFLAIMVLALLAAWKIFKMQKDKTAAINEETAIQEQRIALALELSGLDKKISQDSGPYLKKDPLLSARSFQEFASKAEVKTISVSLPKELNDDFSSAVLFDLELKGSYHNLAKFISILESQENMLRIQSISLKESVGSSEANILSLTMAVGVTYIKGQ
ncbi:MAG: type 4a pilus biogenesis protein PilO [Candidatus Omnitrophota bacterium]